ncbi:hypothetical protein AHAS_Ahas02G0154200 [Arachis hypogaea]
MQSFKLLIHVIFIKLSLQSVFLSVTPKWCKHSTSKASKLLMVGPGTEILFVGIPRIIATSSNDTAHSLTRK